MTNSPECRSRMPVVNLDARCIGRFSLLKGAAWLGLLFSAGSAVALDGTWNSANTGTRVWSTSSFWVGNTVANGAGYTATFNAATAATITASLNGVDRTIGNITVNGVTSGSNVVSIGGPGTLTLATTAPGSRPILNIGGVSTAGLNMGSNVTLAGTQGFEKRGSGRLYLTNVTLTGEILLSEGNLTTTEALGSATPIVVNGQGTVWSVSSTSGAYLNELKLLNGNAEISGSSAPVVLSGIISQEPDAATARGVRYVNSAGGVTNTKHFTVTGNNTYKGDSWIGGTTASASVLRITHDNALGIGVANVTVTGPAGNDKNTLELSGGITVADKALTLNGAGLEGKGSLRSVDGQNVWSGTVNLGSASRATIGVDAGSRLVIDGDISGSNELVKVSEGVLELNGANTSSAGTTISAGTVVAGHDDALGSGPVTVGGLGQQAILEVGTGVQLQLSTMNLTADSRLAFSLDGNFLATGIFVANQVGTGTYTVDISGPLALGQYVLLTSDTWEATGFQLGSTPENFAGDVIWSDGVLTLNVVPEPSVWGLVGLGFSLILWTRVRAKKELLYRNLNPFISNDE